MNKEHIMWECKEESAVAARAGLRQPHSEQERRVLMPSYVPHKASESNFEALTTTMTTGRRAASGERTLVASNIGSEGRRSLTRRGSVGSAIGDPNGSTVWNAAEVAAEGIAIKAAMRSKKKNQQLVDNWAVSPKPKAYVGLWKTCVRSETARVGV